MSESFIVVPTWEANNWSETIFGTMEEFRNFLVPLFKIPGKYKFDETAYMFNEQARLYDKHKFYCVHPNGTRDYITYWDDQKNKCRNGVLYKSKSDMWYIPRDYYMWLNFLPIYNKEISKYGFAKVRDAQYHMALYELLAELHYKHVALLKKRQCASSYFHCGKLINTMWFEEGATLKIGASLKDYINEKNTWKFFVEYKNFLDNHTAWYRPMTPNKMHAWQQQIEVRSNGKKQFKGLKSSLLGTTFDKNSEAGVGGPCKYFFHEEAGIAPKMDQTYEYIIPALSSGFVTTGMFIAAGSVGDLDQCNPLKELILNPEPNDIFAVETDLLDEKNTIGKTGLFIPEQWSMPPYIDEFGNSQVEKALTALNLQFDIWKKELPPDQYQLRISQHPRNIAEAFAHRKASKFPPHLLAAQIRRVEDKEYSFECLNIQRDAEGKIEVTSSRKSPVTEFPIKRTSPNKEGILQVWERPMKDPRFGDYYASIDPVSEGMTTTSESLCSIYIMKAAIQITRYKKGGDSETFLEQERIVACWTGRFDDIKKTHERLELIIEWYNAQTIIENNVSLFIQYMIAQKKQRYMVAKSQIVFLKDLKANLNVYQEYGWKNVGKLFQNILSYAIEYLSEELDKETLPDGKVVKITYGVERIPDIMLLKEMQAYQDGVNVDRLVAFTALVAYASIQRSNLGFRKKIEESDKKLHKSEDFSKLVHSPFRHIGGNGKKTGMSNSNRSPFKHYR